ncbi:response regulator receiver domain protein [Mobiluncus mulieris 28-1]|uniref:Response regulator receiver domain protein n=2 Tax=Mobiluncus mulieris TaxID=2052 RepID=E0QTN9_9ACTO|nr:response regulator transcription factor [Mobiluncus mulieris]EEZ91287.1 response regulator receiver domain protein [Mobiluncus mulieris 28-1]EFM45083.1 response regulator receiver domain protein [Mobiluncus mulieris ATCC 35239]EFN92884.1 response regulator receiver domain protein [Mobiluncus mulieris FB024-16]MBB5845344.1 two-component system response regulator DesR [Mobiluncus mulieris]MCU9970810.1 response regulator transcription factor [Mobiluncus mulieris]
MISVVLADDQALVRGALKALLELEGDLEVVGEAGTGEELLATVAKVTPAVAVVDIEMPDLDGIGATAKIRAAHPQTRVLILTTFGRPGYLRRALEAGASGFMVKDTPSQELARAVREIAAGGRVVDPKLAAESLFEGENPLTPREQEVLREVEAGHHTATIAKTIYLSPGTVRNYLSSAISKTHADTSAGAARYARDQGWL